MRIPRIGLGTFNIPSDQAGALAPLVADGVVRALGLSNAPAALVRRALAVTPLATVGRAVNAPRVGDRGGTP